MSDAASFVAIPSILPHKTNTVLSLCHESHMLASSHTHDCIDLKFHLARQVVRQEVAFSASARHDNIVRLMDVFAEGSQLVIGAWLAS